MKELLSYAFSPLREGDIALYRGTGNGLAKSPILVLAEAESGRSGGLVDAWAVECRSRCLQGWYHAFADCPTVRLIQIRRAERAGDRRIEPRNHRLKSARKAAAPVVVSLPKTPSIGFAIASESEHDCGMIAIAFLFVRVLWD